MSYLLNLVLASLAAYTAVAVCTGSCGLSLTSYYNYTENATHRIIVTNAIPSHSYYSVVHGLCNRE